jgi:hypothetical protein
MFIGRPITLDSRDLPDLVNSRWEVTVVGDGKTLRLAEVMERLAPFGYTEDRVRETAAAGYLKVTRPPKIGRGTPHRRFYTESVDALVRVLSLPDQERDSAMEALKAANAEP